MIQWDLQLEVWTLILQKSTVVPQSSMVLFQFQMITLYLAEYHFALLSSFLAMTPRSIRIIPEIQTLLRGK